MRRQAAPQLVVLDKPTLGVDPVQRADLWKHIRRLRDSGITALLTTNVMEEAAALAHRIAIISGGRLAAPVSTPANLQRGRSLPWRPRRPPETWTRRAPCCTPTRTSPTSRSLPAPAAGFYQVTVTAGGADGVTGLVVMHLAAGRVVIRDVSARTATLDEVFLAVTGSFQAVR